MISQLTGRRKLLHALNIAGWVTAAWIAIFWVIPQHARYFEDYYMPWGVGQGLQTMPLTNIYEKSQKKRLNAELKKRAEQIPEQNARDTAKRTTIAVTGTPLHYALVAATSTGDLDRDYRRFAKATTIAWSAGVLALAWAVGFPGYVAAALLYLLSFAFFPYHMGIALANVTVLQAGLFALALTPLRFRSAPARAVTGAVLAFIACAKPTLAAALPFLLANMAFERRWTEAVWLAGGGLAGGLLALGTPALLGANAATWSEWHLHMGDELFTSWWLTGGFLGKLINEKNPAVYSAFGLALSTLVLGALAWSGGRRAVPSGVLWLRDLSAASMGALVYLLSGPIVHSFYFTLAVPALLYVFRPAPALARTPWTRWAFAAVAAFLIARHPFFKHMGLTRWPHHGLHTFWGVWILAGMIARDWFVRDWVNPWRTVPSGDGAAG